MELTYKHDCGTYLYAKVADIEMPVNEAFQGKVCLCGQVLDFGGM